MIYQLQHLLSESAHRYPDKDAVVYKDSRITYRDLESISNKLAYILNREGAEKGDRIGIYLNKSIKSIASIFGILKAGGVYVPIDPALPPKRLAYIIKDCGIKHLISSGDKIKRLEEIFSLCSAPSLKSVIFADVKISAAQKILSETMSIPWEVVEGSPELDSSVDRINTDLAYILYTSGSTGIPKGVMISHLAAFTFIDWAYSCFKISKDDVVSNHAPLHFDLSIFDIFVTIKAGGTVVLVPETTPTFPVTLTKFIIENKITVWYSVPSALILLLTKGNLEKYKFSDLRLVLFAGEVFPIKYLRKLKNVVSQAKLYNLYGPTETNVCTFYEVKEIPSDQVEPVPIGKAISNYEVFAVNKEGRKIKPGEIGELYARGPGLMLGYWGDTEKTQNGLLPNRFQSHFEEKIYRTGDIVKIDEDGNYLYVGRKDSMIKSRGYRIELGEIETVLYSHPIVKEAVVVAIPDEEVTNRLKAFVVTEKPGVLTVTEIQEYCRDRIPIYMVPETIEFRESFPKTATGKIDRNSLKQR